MGLKVGVVGLGSIGISIAHNVIEAGHLVTVFDLRPEPCAELARVGASVAASLAALASDCEVVLVVVGNDRQLDEVVLGGPDRLGIAKDLARSSVVVVHSTVHPDTVVNLAAKLAELGIELVDAPVSGPDGAEAAGRRKDLTFMVGCKAATLERVRPVLAASGSRILHLGDVGAGQLVKLAANAMTLVLMEVTRESLRLVKQAGLDPAAALEVWKSTSGNSWAVENWTAMQELAQRHPGGPEGLSALGHKDLMHALALAHRYEAPLPLAALVTQLMEPRLGEESGTLI
jgi:3-hydroxyisobutyrate dehydrogenase-like beta-hydroxyacid dehydrogenase